MKKILMASLIWVVLGALAFGAMNYVAPAGSFAWTNPGADVSSGDLVAIGDRYAVALADIASNETGTVMTEGVFSFTRNETNSIAAGALLYYDSATSVTVTATAGAYVGCAVQTLDDVSAVNWTNGTVNKVWVDLNAGKDNTALIGATLSLSGALTSGATPVWTQAQAAAPTNTATGGLIVTVNGTNRIVALYPN